MNVLLVDLILGDHSVPFASNMKRELETRDNISNVDFLTLEPDDRLEKYFNSMNSVYFLEQSHGAGYGTSILDAFANMVEFIKQRSYSVVHFLQVDNLLLESAVILPDVSGLPPIVAQINGAFFGGNRNKWEPVVYQSISGLLSSPLDRIVESGLALSKSHTLVGDISLYRCIQSSVFDEILVHTDAAKEYISDLCSDTTPVTVVPEPSTVEPPAFSQEKARQRIGLGSKETVLLFFGGLRREKGIFRLIESMKQYDGPEFTLLVAGPERSVTEKELRKMENNVVPSLSLDVRYINNSEQYFIASDGVLCPYLSEFGEERTSHVFQEAIRLRRPVICPSFGSFESRLNRYDLGILYSPNTANTLQKAIQKFVMSPDQWCSTSDMKCFDKKHSFKNLCSDLLKIYQRVR